MNWQETERLLESIQDMARSTERKRTPKNVTMLTPDGVEAIPDTLRSPTSSAVRKALAESPEIMVVWVPTRPYAGER